MGENGAGKSTMIKALTGVYKINAGSIEVDGKPQTFTGTGDAQNAGVTDLSRHFGHQASENARLPAQKAGCGCPATPRHVPRHSAAPSG